MLKDTRHSVSQYSNPNCYARGLGDCSVEKSGEHFISRALLKTIENPGKIIIQGPAWLSNNEERSVTANSLKSNILCRKHNSDLSGLDAVGLQFCNYLRNIKAKQENLTLDRNTVERWMLKLLCGFGTSG